MKYITVSYLGLATVFAFGACLSVTSIANGTEFVAFVNGTGLLSISAGTLLQNLHWTILSLVVVFGISLHLIMYKTEHAEDAESDAIGKTVPVYGGSRIAPLRTRTQNTHLLCLIPFQYLISHTTMTATFVNYMTSSGLGGSPTTTIGKCIYSIHYHYHSQTCT
jgi:hypothetical protein